MPSSPFILVTGATGYVGGRLVPRLLECGYRIRILTRDVNRLRGRPWLAEVDVVEGDVLRSNNLDRALTGVDLAYYMVRGKQSKDSYQQACTTASNFGHAACAAGIERIVYLGRLADPIAVSSIPHRSTLRVGDALRQSGIPVTEFRAAMIVGTGSVAFELVRYMTERLPVMILPPWGYTNIQPISIRNTLEYLIAAVETPQSARKIIEIGGPEILTYAEMIRGYALVRGLRRQIVRVPFLPPRLAAFMIHWATPIPSNIALPLFNELRHQVVVKDDLAYHLFPQITPLIYHITLKLAFDRLEQGYVETSWRDALWTSNRSPIPATLTAREGMIIEHIQQSVNASPKSVFQVISGLGGEAGWLYLNVAWRLRGLLDRMLGGVGLIRGRRDPKDLRIGDAVDFWRVERLVPDHLLRLRSEMRLPGNAWLELEANPLEENRASLSLTAVFAPKGLWGVVYWYLLYPIHKLIFKGILKKIAVRAQTIG